MLLNSKNIHILKKEGKEILLVGTAHVSKDSAREVKELIEQENFEEIKEIMKNDGIYRILLDNFNFDDTKKAVILIGDYCQTESSGNITLKTARAYADCGVDYISSGALTHSVYNMDLSLKAV